MRLKNENAAGPATCGAPVLQGKLALPKLTEKNDVDDSEEHVDTDRSKASTDACSVPSPDHCPAQDYQYFF